MQYSTLIAAIWLAFGPVFLICTVLATVLWMRARSRLRAQGEESRAKIGLATTAYMDLRSKYAEIINREERVEELNVEIVELEEKIEIVRKTYKEKRRVLEGLEKQISVYDERISFVELGVYEAHFDFHDSEAFKAAIAKVRDRQKAMVTAKTATRCPTDWTVDGSRSKGQAMINRQERLTLRAFNNECEAAIANARWNNVVAMERRILNAAKQIDAANASLRLEISDRYVALKIDELHLTHEYREQQKAEKEERAELARAEREERKLLQEAEAAEKEEKKYQALLEKARREARSDEGRIRELESALAEARAAGERARAMAQLTKSGYVYVISNIGSFGEEVFKIGLTRRLDPDDRVRELGDASVPFRFDTHAMIYSEDAPALEGALHAEFADRRINTSNPRKEFFRVTLEDVEAAVTRLAPDAAFFKDREAQEWRETLARRNQMLENMTQAESAFPLEI